MQRIVNNPDNIVDEMLNGFLKSHKDIVAKTDNPRVVKYVKSPVDRVGVVTGSGSGHQSGFIGYIGENMCDAVAVGEICSSPTAAAFLDAFRAADGGKGVACLYGNYSGDCVNIESAVKMAGKAGIEVRTVAANDDVSSAPKEQIGKRRGIAGEMFMWKVGGARAAKGGTLDEVIAAAQKAIDNTRSVISGHHGVSETKGFVHESASHLARRMVDDVVCDYPFEAGDEVVVMVSGLGAAPVMELYILYDEVDRRLEEKGIRTHHAYVGNYFTSPDRMGVTLTMMKLDEELKELIDMSVNSSGLKQF